MCVTLFSILIIINQLIAWSSSGLVEQINNFQTLRLRDFSFDPFLSIDDDYFYHTQNPRRPEVSIMMWTSRYVNCSDGLCILHWCSYWVEFLFSSGWGCAREILLRWTERGDVSPRPGSNCECCTWPDIDFTHDDLSLNHCLLRIFCMHFLGSYPTHRNLWFKWTKLFKLVLKRFVWCSSWSTQSKASFIWIIN